MAKHIVGFTASILRAFNTENILDAPGYGFPGQDGVPNENSPPDVTGVSDIDLDELLKGLNIGSPRKERKATTVETNEPDEVR